MQIASVLQCLHGNVFMLLEMAKVLLTYHPSCKLDLAFEKDSTEGANDCRGESKADMPFQQG